MRRAAHHLRSVLYSLYFYLIFFVVSHAFFYYGLCLLGHYRHNSRTKERWRALALKLVDAIFLLTFVQIRVEGREHILEDPVIFASNHQSYLDGLIIFHVLRRPFTAVTGPHNIFPRIIQEWFEHMEYLRVARDVFEELRYKDTIRLGRAVDQCVKILKQKTSVLIFPEGRRELKRHLLPFHSGVARIALEARSPVVPIILEHVDTFLSINSNLLYPTRIGVKILKPVRLENISQNALDDVVYLEREMKRNLPKTYFNEKSIPHRVDGKRGAFFDLDDTLTRSNIYQKLVGQYLVRHLTAGNVGKIPKLVVKRLLLKHGYFYLAAIRLLKGIQAAEFLKGFGGYLKKHKKELFYPEMLTLIHEHQEKGNKVFIISEEPQEILDPISKLLGVPCFGTVLEKKNDVFTGEIVGHIMKDEFKREKMIELAKKYHVDLDKSYAYGDSYHDYAMLRSVAHGAVVNPKKSFGTYCKNLGMRVIHEK